MRKIAYIYGGSVLERMREAERLRANGYYMILSSRYRNRKFEQWINNHHHGERLILSLNGSGYREYLR